MATRNRSSRVTRSFSYQRPTFKSFTTRRLERKSRNKLIVTAIISAFLLIVAFLWLIPALVGGLSFINTFKPKTTTVQQVADTPTLAPPVLNIPYEATNTATIKISGYAQAFTKVELYVDNDLKTTVDTHGDGSFQSDDISLNLGTNNIYGKTVDDQGNTSLPSKTIPLNFDDQKPTLNIDQPEDNTVMNGGDKRITISGSTDSSKDVTVSANGIRIIVNSDGHFSSTFTLNDGDNYISITATDSAGNTTTVTRKVTYNEGSADTPTPTPS
ncbi:hypothetical protein M1563_01875 [Patescibacteria group bacterium]|nr:hypothetical protein [Patescibacteria group bacterium]MCL5409760.1 hypothetical protein [Patescibacteria group bacterium]